MSLGMVYLELDRFSCLTGSLQYTVIEKNPDINYFSLDCILGTTTQVSLCHSIFMTKPVNTMQLWPT